MKTPQVRRFESGTFYELVNAALSRAGVEFKLDRGFAFTPKYRLGRKLIGLQELVQLANKQRKKEGRALLSVPRGPTLGRTGRRRGGK